MPAPERSHTFVQRAATLLVPHRFLASQLRQPRGRFGRWVMTAALNQHNRDLIDATLDALALRPDDVCLDAGFGGGYALELAAARTRGLVWGVDFSPDVVVRATRRFESLMLAGRLQLISADIADLPLRDALVSAICTTNTIYFWPDPAAALASLRRVLAPGGRLAIGYSGAAKMRDVGQVTQHGFTLYDPDRVESLLREAGFRDVRTIAHTGRVTQGDFTSCAQIPASAIAGAHTPLPSSPEPLSG